MKLDENLFEDVDQISIKDKLEYLKNYPTYNNQYTRPCKVWDLGLSDEQKEKFYSWLDEGGLDIFWRDNETLSQDIYQDGRMGGHLIFSQEILNPKDFIDVTSYNELLDEYLDNNYYPDNDDGTYTDRQKQEAKEEVDSLINDAYDKLIDFDNRVDQLIENLKMELDGYVTDRESDDIVENLNESIQEVKNILQPLVTKDGKVRALRDDEKLPRGFRFKSGTGTSGEVTYKGTDYAYAVVNGKLKVMTSAEAGHNWSETIYKEDLDNIQTAVDKMFSSGDEGFPYVMLDRMRSDCEYYLGYGNRSSKYLWAKDPKRHIEIMKAIYNRLDPKPEWLTPEQIDEYEKEMITSNFNNSYLSESSNSKPIINTIDSAKNVINKLESVGKEGYLEVEDIGALKKLKKAIDTLLKKENSLHESAEAAEQNKRIGLKECSYKDSIINGYVIKKSDTADKYFVYDNNGHVEDEDHKGQGYDTFDQARERAESLPKGIAMKESLDINMNESFEDEHLGKVTDCKPEETSSESASETPNPGPESGIAAELNKLIIDEWEAIQGYNDAIVAAELEGYSDIASILRDIANEEMNHVGMLETALSTISPNTQTIKDGEVEASDILEQ